jgi:hypothetical protein
LQHAPLHGTEPQTEPLPWYELAPQPVKVKVVQTPPPSQHAPVGGQGLPAHVLTPKAYPPALQFADPIALPPTPSVHPPVVRLQQRPMHGFGLHATPVPIWVSPPQFPNTPGW